VEPWTVARARLAVHKRHHPDADDTELRAAYSAARLTDLINRTLANGPLTAEQRCKLARLLLDGDDIEGRGDAA